MEESLFVARSTRCALPASGGPRLLGSPPTQRASASRPFFQFPRRSFVAFWCDL